MEIGRSRWAVVGPVPLDRYGETAMAAGVRDLDWVSAVAMAHEAVVEHFSRARGSTVVPMKLFTMFSSADRLVRDLRSQQAGISATMARIRGAREWGSASSEHPRHGVLPHAVSQSAPAPRFSPPRSRPATPPVSDLEAAQHAAEAAFRQLARLAREARRRDDVPDGATAPPLLDAVFLVPIAATVRFRAAVRRAAAECRRAGTAVTMTGPWPAYNFVGPPGARR